MYYQLATHYKNVTFLPISCAEIEDIIASNHAHTKTLLFFIPFSYRNKHSKHIEIH